MENIKIIEDRRNRVKSANSLLPSLLTESELNQINGGGSVKPPICTEVSCGADYTFGVCAWRIDCGDTYTDGPMECGREYSIVINCGKKI